MQLNSSQDFLRSEKLSCAFMMVTSRCRTPRSGAPRRRKFRGRPSRAKVSIRENALNSNSNTDQTARTPSKTVFI